MTSHTLQLQPPIFSVFLQGLSLIPNTLTTVLTSTLGFPKPVALPGIPFLILSYLASLLFPSLTLFLCALPRFQMICGHVAINF